MKDELINGLWMLVFMIWSGITFLILGAAILLSFTFGSGNVETWVYWVIYSLTPIVMVVGVPIQSYLFKKAQ